MTRIHNHSGYLTYLQTSTRKHNVQLVLTFISETHIYATIYVQKIQKQICNKVAEKYMYETMAYYVYRLLDLSYIRTLTYHFK